MNRAGLSLLRWWSIVAKEFLQLRRDRLTFGMIVGLPIVQLALFGFAINTDPRQLPTAVVAAESSEFTRGFVAALAQSGYFRIVDGAASEASARAGLARGELQFVLHVPAGFTRAVLRGERPALLVEADATDPMATGLALGAVGPLAERAAARERAAAPAATGGFEVHVHRLYNPEGNTQYNVVPGLMGVILTMTMVMMTGLAITRERERGTMENLLATPVRPLEVMTGKIVPYVAIGLVQATIILAAARWVFGVPFAGSVMAVYLAALLFVAANLTVGIALSSLARNQLQAMQLTMFYFLPNILLSGFMFPFRGMPVWAQWLGNLLPLTHFNRLVRGILLKGNGAAELWPSVWPLLVFTAVVMTLAVASYRRTLD